jgi:hypothetical protein
VKFEAKWLIDRRKNSFKNKLEIKYNLTKKRLKIQATLLIICLKNKWPLNNSEPNVESCSTKIEESVQ